MRLAIEHRSTYRFSEPQDRVIQLLRLRPCDTDDQTVVSWRIDVDCDARLKSHHDGFGNETTILYADGRIAELEITVAGEVLTTDAEGVVRGAHEPFPPEFYLRTTARTKPFAAIEAFAEEHWDPDQVHASLRRLAEAIAGRFSDLPPVRDQGATAEQVFAQKALTPRGAALVFVTAARCVGVPARYVTGYHRAEAETECAPHAWAEAYVPDLGWVGFDPLAGVLSDERYVRVAMGLDPRDAAPISGWRIGSGEEELDVEISVEQLGGEE